MKNLFSISIAKWKYNKTWVYSATYDEALSDLYKFVIPHHDQFGIPGHVEVVSGHIGNIRNLGASSYNGMKHMDALQLKDIMSRGWGVGCHSWSHEIVIDNPDLELKVAKEKLESTIGRRVTIYTSPGSNINLTKEVIEKAKEYGYLAGMSITDNLNYCDSEDLFWVNRPPLHEKFGDLYDSAFDEFKRIHQAKKYNGWIVDYLHCPLEKAIHDYKDCSAAHHKERLQTIQEEGRYDCWFANPDDVVDYRYMYRHTELDGDINNNDEITIKFNGLPEQVMNRELTFILKCAYTPEALKIIVDDNIADAVPVGGGNLSFTAPVKDGSKIKFIHKIVLE